MMRRSSVSSVRSGRSTRSKVSRRAATIAEYAILLVGVMLIAAGGYKVLGNAMSHRLDGAGNEVTGGAGGGGGGGGNNSSGGNSSGGASGGIGGSSGGKSASGGGGGGGGGGGTGADGKPRGTMEGAKAADKVAVGGAGEANQGGGGGSSANGAGGASGASGQAQQQQSGEQADASTLGDEGGTNYKRIMAISFIVSGILAMAYFGFKAKKATKAPPK